jgi:hypothetical protein
MSEVCITIPSSTINIILSGVVISVLLTVINLFCPFASNLLQNRLVHIPTTNVLKVINDNLQAIS